MVERASQSLGKTKLDKLVDDDVRARVIVAAIALIDDGGLATLSMREVARAAGVSHQAPYHYFADREAILAAVAEHGFDLLTKRLEPALVANMESGDRFYEAGTAYVRFACENRGLFRIMFRQDFVDPDKFPRLKVCGENAFEVLPTTVRALIAGGLAPVPSEQALVILCWSLVHGLASLLLDGPLAIKVPDVVTSQDVTIHETLTAMRHLLARASGGASKAEEEPRRPKKESRVSPSKKTARPGAAVKSDVPVKTKATSKKKASAKSR